MSTYNNESGNFRSLVRHEEYFINGGDLYFLVQHVLFRVHRYFFERESPVFQQRLAGSASPGSPRPGSSESNSIVLEQVASEHFAKFLWVFYNPRYSLYKATVDDWKIILHQAFEWQFAEVRKLVVRELEKLEMNDVDRISTYHRYEIDRNLLMPRYAALCAREEPLTLKEGRDLGLETTLMIAHARESARANPTSNGMRSPIAAGIQQDEMYTLIRTLFEIPSPTGESEAVANGIMTPPGGSEPNQRPPSSPPSKPQPPAKPTAKPPPTEPVPPPPPKTQASVPPPPASGPKAPPSAPPQVTIPQTPGTSQAQAAAAKPPPPVETPGKKLTGKKEQTGKTQQKAGNTKKGKQQQPTTPQTPSTTEPEPASLPPTEKTKKEETADHEPSLLDSQSPLGKNGDADSLLKASFMYGFDNILDMNNMGGSGEEKDTVAGSGGAAKTDQVKDADELVNAGNSDVLPDHAEPEQTTVVTNGLDELDAAKAAVAVDP